MYAVQISHSISSKDARYQNGGGSAVQIRHIISMVTGMQYRTTKTIQSLSVVGLIWENNIYRLSVSTKVCSIMISKNYDYFC